MPQKPISRVRLDAEIKALKMLLVHWNLIQFLDYAEDVVKVEVLLWPFVLEAHVVDLEAEQLGVQLRPLQLAKHGEDKRRVAPEHIAFFHAVDQFGPHCHSFVNGAFVGSQQYMLAVYADSESILRHVLIDVVRRLLLLAILVHYSSEVVEVGLPLFLKILGSNELGSNLNLFDHFENHSAVVQVHRKVKFKFVEDEHQVEVTGLLDYLEIELLHIVKHMGCARQLRRLGGAGVEIDLMWIVLYPFGVVNVEPFALEGHPKLSFLQEWAREIGRLCVLHFKGQEHRGV